MIMGSIYGQKHNAYIQGKYAHVNKNDVVFTPDWLAKKMCLIFPISGSIFEPCKGEGVFLKYLPPHTQWAEITEGKNLYDFNEHIDWIVTNPPYSDFNRFLNHCFKIADNVVLLVPVAKMFKSLGTLETIYNYGGIVAFYYLSASKAGFPFGFPCGVCYIKRGYKGMIDFRNLNHVQELTKQQSLGVL